MGADKKTAVSDLMEQGKLKGKLTTKEITDALEELDFDVEQMDKLYDSLENLNIEIIEDFNIVIYHCSHIISDIFKQLRWHRTVTTHNFNHKSSFVMRHLLDEDRL